MQTRQLYPGYVPAPLTALIPEVTSGNLELLGFGTVPFFIAGNSPTGPYIFPLAGNEGMPAVMVEKGIFINQRIAFDPEADSIPVTVAADTRFPVPGITNWAVQVPVTALQGWTHPILHIRWQAILTNGQPLEKHLYYPISH
jgi:hypothetical protein